MRGETKEERFKRVAEKRVQRVLDSIISLAHCSNKRMYSWNNEQLRKIWTAIDIELEACKASFKNSEPKEFKF